MPGQPASFWRRCGAQVLDGLLLGVCVSIVGGMTTERGAFYATTGPLPPFSLVYEVGRGWQAKFGGFPVSLGTRQPRHGASPTADQHTMPWRVVGILAAGYVVYYTFLTACLGGTLGKRLLGLSVLHEDGRRCRLRTAMWRYFAYWISALPFFLGFLWALWQPRKQAWHDTLCKTLVIHEPKSELSR